jgi:hypothetical protein
MQRQFIQAGAWIFAFILSNGQKDSGVVIGLKDGVYKSRSLELFGGQKSRSRLEKSQ